MQMPDTDSNHRRASLLVVIFVFLTSTYLLTYSGRITSTDTLFLLDATGSLVRYGDMRLDIGAGVRPPLPDQLQVGEGFAPLPDVDAEPLQIVLAAPLFWLADQFSGIGQAHLVYLFNVIVSAVAGCLICVYALVLGYEARVGVGAAVLFGLGTIVWPYSKTFFQEPLALVLVLTTALMVETWRRGSYRAVGWLLLAVAAGLCAVLSKRASLLALPALIVLAMPGLPEGSSGRRQVLRSAVILILLLVVLLVIASEIPTVAERIDAVIRFVRRTSGIAAVALHSYLLSIGGSIWGTSPVLLMVLPGVWLLHRQRHYRYTLILIVMLAIFALVYAYGQGRDWFGGLSWPPRFMIPVVPFGVLVMLPVIDRALRRPISRWLLAGILLLAGYSIWVQLSGVTLAWSAYSEALPPESGQLGEWGGGLNLVRYLRWVVIPSLWGRVPLDIAWVRLKLPLWALVCGLLVVVSGFVLWRGLRQNAFDRGTRAWVIGLPVVLALATLAGMRSIHDDPLYQADNAALWAMMPVIAAETETDDIVLLSDLTYERFFTNFAKRDMPRMVSLPFQPGEQPSPQQPPEIVSDNPDLLLHKTTGPLIFALAETRERLWMLASNGPFLPWSVRPVERFMATHYYPVQEFQTDPTVRLIEYSTIPAPDPFLPLGPEYVSDLVYGEHIRLLGYELPAGTAYEPGQTLPLSLYWQTEEPLEQSYKIAWFVRDAGGGPVAQGRDLEPGGGFALTNTWHPGVPIWDNRALHLPETVVPGEYRLWVVVYTTDLDGNIVNSPVRGAETVDGYIGILPTILQIEG